MIFLTENKSVTGQELPCKVYVDGILHKNFKKMNEMINDDWDVVGLYAGKEGSGKTVKAMQDALILDANFSLDNIVFNPQQFHEAVENSPKGSVIMWDESDDLARNWQSKIIQNLTRYFKRIRSKNLYIILVTPTLFDMRKQFVVHRLNYVIKVYAKNINGKLTRGFFEFYNDKKIRKLYIDGRKYMNWGVETPNFRGRFTKLPDGFPVDWEAYQFKKDEATKNVLDVEDTPKKIKIAERRKHLKRLNDFLRRKYNKTWTYEDYSSVFGVSTSQIGRDFKEIT